MVTLGFNAFFNLYILCVCALKTWRSYVGYLPSELPTSLTNTVNCSPPMRPSHASAMCRAFWVSVSKCWCSGALGIQDIVNFLYQAGITIINNLGEMINFQPYIKCQVGIISHLSEPTDRGSSNLKHGYSATSTAWYPPHLKVYIGMNASSAWIQQASRVALVSSICCKRMLNVHTTTKEEIQLQAGK